MTTPGFPNGVPRISHVTDVHDALAQRSYVHMQKRARTTNTRTRSPKDAHLSLIHISEPTRPEPI
eukprot:4618598-Pyramimonas_sp.AAC.1